MYRLALNQVFLVLTLCFFLQPVPEELQNGPGFGYVVAFRPHGATGWMQAAVPSPEASRYVFKNESIQPFSPFHVKVGVYNNEGEGPFGPVTTIYSAEEGAYHLMSSTTCYGVALLALTLLIHKYKTRSSQGLNSGSRDCAANILLSALTAVFPILSSVSCSDEICSFETVLMLPL